MVTRYFHDDEPSFRRYTGRGHGYPLTIDRESSSGPNHGPYGGHRHHQQSTHEGRSSGHSPEQDSNASNPRRRIPVACGRCRKRKIRCSGDPGNGQPCTNCKSAGTDSCQFLRVSSTEAVIKHDSTDSSYHYDSAPAVSRLPCRMVPSAPQLYAPPINLGPDGFPYHRTSMSAYQYPFHTKGFYEPSYSDFSNESVDYGLPSTSYPLLGADSVGLSYGGGSTGRGWTPAPQHPKVPNGLFLEQDSTYNHGQYTNSFPIRSMVSSDSKISLTGMASALPGAITERMLPYPSTGRQPSTSFIRSGETHSILQSSQPIHYSHSGLVSTSMMNEVKALNNNSLSQNASMSAPYLPLTNSTSDSVPSSQFLGNNQQTEMYGSSSGNALYRQTNDSSSSISNGYSPSSRKPSQGSDHSSPTTGMSNGNLTNGHAYVPFVSQYNPPPPMEEMPLPLTHRSSEAGLQQTSIQAS